jgi:predicted ArsR family transcriptional regulator
LRKLWIGVRDEVEHLRRLAVVFAVPIRLRIVNELYRREMSPKEFFEEFGGGSLPRVAQHFERLAKMGWLRLIDRKGPGGKRRGRAENFYRATELAFCDRATFAALPPSLKIGFAWNTLREIAEQLRAALEAPLPTRPSRNLTAARLVVDREGWTRIADACGEAFANQEEEQEDARRRVGHGTEKLFRAGSMLIAFQLPGGQGVDLDHELAEGRHLMVPFAIRVSKVIEDEVCLQILDEANHRDISVPLFYEEYGMRFGLSKDAIRRRFEKLLRYGWLKVVGYKTGGRRRGATENFYRATGPALYDEHENGPWANLPDSLADAADWQAFERLSDWAKAAMVDGAVTRNEETCLAWSILYLDEPGWERVVASLEELQALVDREQKLAAARLQESGEEPIEMAVALGAFDTPKPPKEH